MKNHRVRQADCRHFPGKAFTIVEAAVSALVVGGMLVAALTTVGRARLTTQSNAEAVRGQALAQELMADILRQHYEEPNRTPRFGWEGTNEGNGSRDYFDDVDDYYKWSAFPPQDKSGAALSGFDGWQRIVMVEWVLPTDVNTGCTVETGAKRITVTVSRDGRLIASAVAVRTSAGQEPRVKGSRK